MEINGIWQTSISQALVQTGKWLAINTSPAWKYSCPGRPDNRFFRPWWHAGYTTNSLIILYVKFKFYSKTAIQKKDLDKVCKSIYPITQLHIKNLAYYHIQFAYWFIDWLFLVWCIPLNHSICCWWNEWPYVVPIPHHMNWIKYFWYLHINNPP